MRRFRPAILLSAHGNLQMIRYAVVLFAVLLAAGCSSVKTVGTVDMDKLVSLDTVWANLDAYTGRMITLKFDTIYTTSTGWGKIPTGQMWNTTGISTTTWGLWTDEQIGNKLTQIIDAECPQDQEKCFADAGQYHVDITNVGEKTSFPDSISQEEILRPFDGSDFFNEFETSRHRVLTCYLLGGFPREIRGPDRYNLLSRYMVVAPVGFQYDPKDKFLPVSWK